MKKSAIVMLIILCLGLVACGAQGGGAAASEKSKAQVAVFATNMGSFEVDLKVKEAPATCANFVKLAKSGFYKGTTFHRVIAQFMIQGGDPTGTGMGGPGYKIKDEFSPRLKHDAAGVLSMANAGPNTGGSQFFITLVPCPWLDGKHAVFGRVKSGMEVIEAIGKVPTDKRDKPVSDVVIKDITIKE